MVNLFINLLYDPALPSAQSDLNLMDVASGYFARLEYTTDAQWTVPLLKDIATLSRNAVERSSGVLEGNVHHQENTSIANPILPTLTAYEPIVDEDGTAKEVRSP